MRYKPEFIGPLDLLEERKIPHNRQKKESAVG
jgi:hypothetical protein